MSYESGEYLFKVERQGFGQNQTGSSYFFLEGTPVAIIQEGQEYSVQPFQRTIRLTITEKTVDFVVDKLTSVGWPGGKWSTLDPDQSSHHSFVGQELRVRCTKEPGINDPSKLFEKWDLPFQSEPTENNPAISRKLDQMFGRSAAAAAKKAPARAPAKVNREMQEAAVDSGAEDDDGIPF